MITKERAAHLCKILNAMAEGKQIQWRTSPKEEWFDATPSLGLHPAQGEYEYRIKPEPRKTYYRLWENIDGIVCVVTADLVSDQRGWTEYSENRPAFKRWVGDWQEHGVPE